MYREGGRRFAIEEGRKVMKPIFLPWPFQQEAQVTRRINIANEYHMIRKLVGDCTSYHLISVEMAPTSRLL